MKFQIQILSGENWGTIAECFNGQIADQIAKLLWETGLYFNVRVLCISESWEERTSYPVK